MRLHFPGPAQDAMVLQDQIELIIPCQSFEMVARILLTSRAVAHCETLRDTPTLCRSRYSTGSSRVDRPLGAR